MDLKKYAHVRKYEDVPADFWDKASVSSMWHIAETMRENNIRDQHVQNAQTIFSLLSPIKEFKENLANIEVDFENVKPTVSLQFMRQGMMRVVSEKGDDASAFSQNYRVMTVIRGNQSMLVREAIKPQPVPA